MDWQKDLGSYPDHFQKIVREKLGEEVSELPGPVELVPSGIRILPAEEQILEYLNKITPKGRPTTFRFESAMFWIAVGSVGSGLGIIVLTLLVGG